MAVTIEPSTSTCVPPVFKNFDLFASAFSGGLANAISRTCVAPLERTRLQLAVDSHHVNALQCVRSIVHKEGFAGLWAGNTLNVLRIFPQGAIAFWIKDGIPAVLPTSIQGTTLGMCIGGLIGGIISMSAVYPLDYVRIRMTTSPTVYPNWYSGLHRVYQEGGLQALYKGVSHSNAWAGPYYLVQFTSYDTLKQYWLRSTQTNALSPIQGLILGCISGMLCVAAAYPLESIRRKLQVQGIGGRPILYNSWFDCFTKTIRQTGVTGLYRGLGANLVKAPLSIGITFASYEFLMRYVFHSNIATGSKPSDSNKSRH